MTFPKIRSMAWPSVLLAIAACGHSEPFVTAGVDQQGPFETGTLSRLTLNADADYLASWTADGAGILYTFGDRGRADHDRCLAILPGGGGTRQFTLCDNRPGHADSAETIASGALSTDGKLLYLVGASLPSAFVPGRVTLFLADTVTPLNRQALLSMPLQLGGLSPNWLGDITWVAPDQFVAMAQENTVVPSCIGCPARDTVFNQLGVVRGTITSSGATLQLVAGTEGTRSFSVADNRTSIVFIQGLTISKVPVAGGAITPIATLPPGIDKRIDDVSCRETVCVVNVYEQVLSPLGSAKPVYTLLRLTLAGGAVAPLNTTEGIWSNVRLSPANGDVVLRVGSL
ncbi:MAG: hypothetical protein V4503_08555, partial [Gemmatimonadota bacterium]